MTGGREESLDLLLMTNSLQKQVFYRLLAAFAASGLVVIIAVVWFQAQAEERAVRSREKAVVDNFHERLAGLHREWEEQATQLKLNLEFTRILESDRRELLKSFFLAQGSASVFSHAIIFDPGGSLYMWYGLDDEMLSAFTRTPEKGPWFYYPSQKTLYHVLKAPVWFGRTGTGDMFLLRPIDNALLGRIATPEADLYLLLNGRVLASSLGQRGVEQFALGEGKSPLKGAPYAQETIFWKVPHPAGAFSPGLIVRLKVQEALSGLTVGLIALMALAVLAIASWVLLGDWISRIISDIVLLKTSSDYFAKERRLPGAGEREERGDELGALKTGLVSMMQAVVENEQRLKDGDAALRKERDFTAGLVGAAPVIILLLDIQGGVQYVNPYFEQLTGHDLEGLRGKEWFATLLPARDQDRGRALFHAAVNDVPVSGNINPIVTRNGEEREIQWNAKVMRDAQGNVTALLSVGLDITERQQAEEKYRNILQTAIDGFWTTDSRGRMLEVNDAYCRMSGYSREELLLMSIPELEAEENPGETAKHIEKIIVQGYDRFESKHRRKNGTVFDIEVSVQYSNQQGGTFVVFVKDITGRRRAEKALFLMNRALRTLSKCSEVVMRAKSEQDLLREGCQAIVAEGGYLMAWVGYAEDDEKRTVRPVQECGCDGKHLETVKMSWADTEYGGGPAGTAIRTGKYLVVQNVQTDARFAPWREEAVRRGFASIIGLPLKTGGSVLGALTIYAAEPEAFDADELRLLLELAEDIAFGIMALRTQKAREEAEAQLRRNYDAQTVVNEILRISLSEVDLQTILQRGLDLVLDIPWLSDESKGAIFLAGNRRNKLVMKVQKGLPEHVQKKCASVPFGACLCGRAALTMESQFADRADERHDNCSEEVHSHGHYCVPIVSAGRTLGVMTLCLGEGHPEDENEKAFLGTIANVLAGAVQRKQTEEERKNLYRELQDAFEKVSRSQKEWQGTFDAITDLIVILDKDYRIIRANRAVSEYFGVQIEEIVNKTCHEIFHSLHSPIFGCPFKTAFQNSQSLSCEVRDEKNRKTLQVSVFPYYSAGGEIQGMVHISRDITEEKENEMRLILSERLASLGQMASGIAHEINNPLAAIAGCAEGLLSRIERDRFDPVLFNNYLKIIFEEVVRCKKITNSMLSFVRKTDFDKSKIDMNNVLTKALEVIGFQGRLKEVQVTRDFQNDLPVYGSEDELKQVCLAVITNALDAMEDRGLLTISTETCEKAVIIRITDTGPGIDPEHVARIFEPFFTTRGGKGGTGLGLAIARKIVLSHNGSLEVTSEKDKGTTFIISLPL